MAAARATMSNNRRLLRGTEHLRANHVPVQHGPATVADLIDALDYQGFEIAGRSSKAVSDALRREMTHGRMCRLKHGRYGPLEMPKPTEYRTRKRVLALREKQRSC